MAHKISFSYGQLGKSELFNNLMYKISPIGLYTNVTLVRVDDTTVTVPSFVGYINDSANELGARIENTTDENVSLTSSTPYLIARLNWLNSVSNDFELISSNFGSITSSDIILGKANYTGAVLVDFDYTEQMLSPLSNNGADLIATLRAFGFPSEFINSTPYTVSSSDKILSLFVDSTVGDITINLPTASISNVNNLLYIYNVAGTNNILIASTSYSISVGRLMIFRCVQTGSSTYAWQRHFSDEEQIGITAPASTPEKIGQRFIDITNKKVYIATGTSASTDWICIDKKTNTLSTATNYIITDTDQIERVEVDTTSGDITITLPTRADNLGRRISIANVKGSNKVIIAADGGESKITQDGLTVVWLPKVGNYIVLQECATSTFWEVIDEKIASQLRINAYAGYGSTDNKILRFSNLNENFGNMFSENHSTGYSGNSKGLEITINRSGRYSICFSAWANAIVVGISKNSSQLTTDVSNIFYEDILQIGYTYQAAIVSPFASWTGYLEKGDIIRPHSNGNASSGLMFFTASYLG